MTDGRVSRKGLSWIKWYIADWLGSSYVRGLAWAERGLYAELLMLQADSGTGDLPADANRMRRMSGASESEWAELWPAISDHFPLSAPGRRANPKMSEVWGQQMRQTERRRRAAKAGADARWSNQECESHSDSHGSQSQSQSRETGRDPP